MAEPLTNEQLEYHLWKLKEEFGWQVKLCSDMHKNLLTIIGILKEHDYIMSERKHYQQVAKETWERLDGLEAHYTQTLKEIRTNATRKRKTYTY